MNLNICLKVLNYWNYLISNHYSKYVVQNTPTYLFLSYTLLNSVNLQCNELYSKVINIYNLMKYNLENSSSLIQSYKVSLNNLTLNVSIQELNNLCLYYYSTNNSNVPQRHFRQFLTEQIKLYNFEQLFDISFKEISTINANNTNYKSITDVLFFTWIYTEILEQNTIILCDNSDLNYENILNLARKYYQYTNHKTSTIFPLQCYLVTHVIFCESHFGSKSLRNTSSICDNDYYYQRELDFIINCFNQVKDLKLWEILAEFVFSLQILSKFQINKNIEELIHTGQTQLMNHAIIENDETILKWNNISKRLEANEHMAYCALVALIPAKYRHQFMIDSYKDFAVNRSITLQQHLDSEGYLFIRGALNYNNCSASRRLVVNHLNSMGLAHIDQDGPNKASIKKNVSGLTIDVKSGELIGDTGRSSDNNSEQVKAEWLKLFNNDLFKMLHSSSTIQAIFTKIFPHHDVEIISGETWMRIKGKGGKTREHSDYAYERDNTKIFSNPMIHSTSNLKACCICHNESSQSILICDWCGKSFHYVCNLNQYPEAMNYTDISTHTIHQSEISQIKDNDGCWNCYVCSNNTIKPIYTVWISLSDINENSNSSILQVIPKSHLLGRYGLPSKNLILKSHQHNNVNSDDLPSNYTAEYMKSNNFISPSALRCGDIVLFNCNTIHRATINESDEFRLSIDVRVKLHERRNNSIHRPNLPVKSKTTSVPRRKKPNLNTRYFNAVAELNRIIMTNQTYNEDNTAPSVDLLSNFSSFMQPFIAVIQSFQSKDNKQLLTESIEQFNSLLSRFKQLLFKTHRQLSIYNHMVSVQTLRYIEPQIRFIRRDKTNNYNNCNNIVFDWSHKLIIDHNIPNKGTGVRAAVDIPAYSAIRYYGEVIDKNTMEKRLGKGQCKHVFQINQNKYLDGNPDLDYLPKDMAIAALINEPGPDEIVNCRWSKQGTDIIVIPFPILAGKELLCYYGLNYMRDYFLGGTKLTA